MYDASWRIWWRRKLVSTDEYMVYRHDYAFDACKQQGLTFIVESFAPIRSTPVDGYLLQDF